MFFGLIQCVFLWSYSVFFVSFNVANTALPTPAHIPSMLVFDAKSNLSFGTRLNELKRVPNQLPKIPED